MIEIRVPGHRDFRFEHLVLDYNGTLACDGELIDEVRLRLIELAKRLRIHVLTADTFGNARTRLVDVDCEVLILGAHDQAEEKRAYVEKLGPEHSACIGNGRNDCLMLESAALAIVVLGREGAAGEALAAAHVVTTSIAAALDLLTHPLRLVATLRT